MPANFPTISAEALAPRKKLIPAIGNYSQALGTASDPATIQDLQDAATSLATTVGTAASPFLGPAATPIITPVARLVGRGFGLAVENTYAPEIHAVMQRADPDVAVAASLLKESIATIARHDQDALTAWSIEKQRVLNMIGDHCPTESAAIAEYRNAVAEALVVKAKVDSLDRHAKLLDLMVAAHRDLITPDLR